MQKEDQKLDELGKFQPGDRTAVGGQKAWQRVVKKKGANQGGIHFDKRRVLIERKSEIGRGEATKTGNNARFSRGGRAGTRRRREIRFEATWIPAV